MKLIVISHQENIANEAEIVNQLFDNHMEYFHLRKPGKTIDDTKQFLDLIRPEYHSKIALHQHHSLAKDYGINRLHITEEGRAGIGSMDLTKLKSEGFVLSTSVHNISSLSTINAIFNYSFLSPVFDSISKKGYKGIFDPNFDFQRVYLPIQVIALGGIKIQNYNILLKHGFHGIAVLGALWNRPKNAVREFKALKADIDKIYSPKRHMQTSA
ncbi:thiamine phosphate synthase [Desertivirga xinjiangensis]|uniref:thiamine phosphate synthase n=1 Tax=Desertivirga xinjiangensis TaxID=539206 RepID=UPI00210A5C12|nr:thiamine phosphate synthase [Pedobacter xinjiangensis]